MLTVCRTAQKFTVHEEVEIRVRWKRSSGTFRPSPWSPCSPSFSVIESSPTKCRHVKRVIARASIRACGEKEGRRNCKVKKMAVA